jgi:hypothetical protein
VLLTAAEQLLQSSSGLPITVVCEWLKAQGPAANRY